MYRVKEEPFFANTVNFGTVTMHFENYGNFKKSGFFFYILPNLIKMKKF